ncbi:hypothetical protein CDEST_14752 [Colletotrichum destructivum]|uniref:Uncharacterized protein n=1 Tax=Colletotrichum destructivum TaxID=34406 RepID=A0AAX4J2U9_9PEZI|nr:hypothetical protein CDEST_14752 [Colletotrichum destructivum]
MRARALQGFAAQSRRRTTFSGLFTAPIGRAVYAESRARKATRMTAQSQLQLQLQLHASRPSTEAVSLSTRRSSSAVAVAHLT